MDIDGTVVGGITRQSVRLGTEFFQNPTSGEPEPRTAGVRRHTPGGSIATKSVAAGIAAVAATSPYSIAIEDIAAGLKLYAQALASGGARRGALSHRLYTITEGVLGLQGISVADGGDAELMMELLAVYDGSNDPVQITDNQSLPSGVTDSERFALGPITLGDVTIDQALGVDVNFGLTLRALFADGETLPRFSFVQSVVSSMTIRGINLAWLGDSAIPFEGKVLTHANSTVYLRKRAETGFVADGTEEHISMTVAGVAAIQDGMDAAGLEPGTCNIEARAIGSDSNDPLVIDTTAAIT